MIEARKEWPQKAYHRNLPTSRNAGAGAFRRTSSKKAGAGTYGFVTATRKVAGRRNTKVPKFQLKHLRAVIGDPTALRKLDYEFLLAVRIAMLDSPVVIKKWQRDKEGKRVKLPVQRQRSIVDVDRKMTLLRHMLRVARRKKWMVSDPFLDAPKTLITPGDEKKRRRVMSFEEEALLLAQCVEPRAHLRIVIIGLVDSLMRATEFFKLRVGDLALDSRNVTVQQMNTKTLVERSAPMSLRFARELSAWIEARHLSAPDQLFDFESVKRSWATAKREAGVSDLRIKDLRRTGATRLYRVGMPIGEISRILGHTTIGMTYEYIGVDRDTTGRANELLDAMHEAHETQVSDALN